MQKIIISGCNGRMGQVVSRLCQEQANVTAVAGFDANAMSRNDYPVFSVPGAYQGEADAVIDFSSPNALSPLLSYCVDRCLPVVLATTGYTEQQIQEIDRAASRIPIFRSANMSLGLNLLLDLVRKAAAVLGDSYDIEIVERHHNKKVDAPSGTALMLADAAAAALPYSTAYVYDRHSKCAPRSKREIGISAIRGGNIVGEHEILFAGQDESIKLNHQVMSREIFAAGALKAALFLVKVGTPGLYSMADLVGQ